MPDNKMVFQHSEKPFNDEVGLGIFKGGEHVGFIFKEKKSGILRRLHFDFKGLRDEELIFNLQWLWTPSDLDSYNKIHLGGYLNAIHKHIEEKKKKKELPDLQKIPYAIHHLTFCFTPDGKYVPLPKDEGFTCVTFVLRLLASNSYLDIEWDSWPDDRLSENIELMEEYNNWRQAHGDEPMIFVKNSRRVRPEECIILFFKANKKTKITFEIIKEDSLLAKTQIEKLWKRQVNA